MVNRVLVLVAFLVLPLMASEVVELELVRHAPQGRGLLARAGKKQVVIVSGSAEEMGLAHGSLLAGMVSNVTPRTMALVGAGLAVKKGEWFYDRIDEIVERATPHTPVRFIEECCAMARGSGISERDALCANFFPELFHCSGVAVRGKASAGGEVIHARVLDYMRDIHLQKYAVLQVFIPDKGLAWVSVGFAGFLGTVTAMNERGLSIGEMGGGGEGAWDGMPMTFLLREIAERAGSVAEALEIMRQSPRTCEYYYVLSDAARNMVAIYATPDKFMVLEPGEQSERLPHVPEDTVLASSGARAKALAERVGTHYGKITPEVMIEIIKRPVAMRSNLHNAIFMPERREMLFADAGRSTPACDEPYTRVSLDKMVDFYRKALKERNGAME